MRMADEVPDRGPQLLGVNYFFATFALLTVALRCYTRIAIVKRFALDDRVMLVALVCIVLLPNLLHWRGVILPPLVGFINFSDT